MSYGFAVGQSSGPITSTGNVKATQGILLGYLVTSTSSGTIKAWDGLTGAEEHI